MFVFKKNVLIIIVIIIFYNSLRTQLKSLYRFQGINGVAASSLLHLINGGEPKVAILGPTRSGSLSLTGEITPVYNLMQVCLDVDSCQYKHVIKIRIYVKLIKKGRTKGHLSTEVKFLYVARYITGL